MIGIHEPDVVFTDLGLAVLGSYFGWRLRRVRGASVMTGLASAAFWGAIFHGFFPDGTATPPGFVAWLAVAFSILVVAASLLDMALSLLLARQTASAARVIVVAYGLVFLAVILFIDESFATVVLLYGPVLMFALLAAAREEVRARSRTWGLVALGLALSATAALAQRAGVALHAAYFDHNATYHLIQAVALVVLYVGFARTRLDAR
jgi:hypothetical protein